MAGVDGFLDREGVDRLAVALCSKGSDVEDALFSSVQRGQWSE
jgi:hypothetical protein